MYFSEAYFNRLLKFTTTGLYDEVSQSCTFIRTVSDSRRLNKGETMLYNGAMRLGLQPVNTKSLGAHKHGAAVPWIYPG